MVVLSPIEYAIQKCLKKVIKEKKVAHIIHLKNRKDIEHEHPKRKRD